MTLRHIEIGIRTAHLSGLYIGPPHQPVVIVEKQVALGGARADDEGRGEIIDH